jgi:3-oxoacyl-[acyl-carrier-protein] synthase II
MERRVAITAAAAITPVGNRPDDIFDNLVKGVSGVRPLRDDELLTRHIHSRVYGTVESPPQYSFARQHRKTMGPVSYYACQVAREVLETCGFDPAYLGSGRVGVAFGSTHGSPSAQRSIYRRFFTGALSDPEAVQATDYLKSMVHTTAVNITRMFGITGRVLSSCTACTTSSQSLGYGYEMVKYGLQDAMLCGGADEYDTTTVAVFDNLLACSTGFNETPSRTPRPFDQERDGLVVAEGAGAVMLEDWERARARGARILAEVIGFACTNNGGDLILPNLQGVKRTLAAALESAAITPEQVDFISAHATATRMGDIIEAQAIHAIYGDRPLVTAFKGHTGHPMGSCGVIETIFCLTLMDKGTVVPTLNLQRVDERCAMIRHTPGVQPCELRTIAVQNFAFGGVNTCLLLRRCD